MDNKVYLHGIYARKEVYSRKDTLIILREILKSGALLSANGRGIKNHKILFNGLDYISLCDYEKRNEFLEKRYNAYEMYIRYSLSLMFPKELVEAIIPEMVKIRYKTGFQHVIESYGTDPDTRYSDLPDEVQVKDQITLDKLSGITLPISRIDKGIFQSEQKLTDAVLKEVEAVNKVLDEYNYQVPIYDIDTAEPLDTTENIKNVVKYHKKYRLY